MGDINKFAETADRFKRFKAKREARLDDLNAKMDVHEPREDEVFRRYEGVVEEFTEQMKQFELDAETMRNTLDEKEGGTEGTVTKFPDTGQKTGTG